MPRNKRPASVGPDATSRKVWLDIQERSVYFKFDGGAGIGIHRENAAYYETIGRWFCNEVDAMATVPEPEGR